MKQLAITQKVIGENTFYIKPFSAFTAANISGELAKLLTPVVGALVSVIGISNTSSVKDAAKEAASDIMSMEIEELAPKLGDALSGLSGDSIERLMRKLLVDFQNITVEGPATDGSTMVLDYDLANEVFCAELQDMYALCFEVIKVNFKGFFSKIAGQFGDLQGASGTETTLAASAV